MEQYTKTEDGKLAQLVTVDLEALAAEQELLRNAVANAQARIDDIQIIKDKAKELGIIE